MSVATVYAKALYETLKGKNGAVEPLDTQLQQLREFAQVLKGQGDLREVLTGPLTSPNEKVSILEKIGEKSQWTPVVRNFLYLLARKARLALLAPICDAFEEIRIESEGGILGTVESADGLSEQDLQGLAQAFTQKLGKTVHFRPLESPELLAGLRVTVNGVTYDGTLRSQLERLREKLIHA